MRRSVSLPSVVVLLVALLFVAGCGPKVPDVVGKRPEEAVRVLQDAGYKLGAASQVATTGVPLGTVAAQTPAAGESARDGSAVDLAICFANGDRVLVPNVVGQTSTTAKGVGSTLGLSVMTVQDYSASAKPDTVATQVPEPGGEVSKGAYLVIVVSKGPAPETAAVPDVKGKSQSEAESAIEAAGFVAEALSSYSSDVAKGTVMGQVPAKGTSLRVGSTVQIVVSLGPGTGSAKVPSVTGKTESEANAAIQAAGMKVHKTSQYDPNVAAGKVIAQFPDAGTTAAAGSEVLIVVSRGPQPVSTVTVPNVTGKSKTDAQATLDEAGFVVTAQKAPNAPAGDTVLYQFPPSQSKAAPGSAVLIVTGSESAPQSSQEASPGP